LDDSGSPPSSGEKEITIEVVEGTREELYWMKVPEKLRKQAVEKAVFSHQFSASLEHGEKRRNTDDIQAQGARNPRKRRKR
jgi:hypothetical protein